MRIRISKTDILVNILQGCEIVCLGRKRGGLWA